MICCVTGHRPGGFPFITGMADGALNTLKYAVSKGKIVKYIMLADIKNQYWHLPYCMIKCIVVYKLRGERDVKKKKRGVNASAQALSPVLQEI